MAALEEEYERAKRQSIADIASGSPRLYEFNARGDWGRYMVQLMQDRFSVTVEQISDIIADQGRAFCKGYNSATIEYFDAKHGPGSYDTALAEVQRYRHEQAQLWRRNSE